MVMNALIGHTGIVYRFCSGVQMITVPIKPYDLHSIDLFGKYLMTQAQVFEQIAEYLND